MGLLMHLQALIMHVQALLMCGVVCKKGEQCANI